MKYILISPSKCIYFLTLFLFCFWQKRIKPLTLPHTSLFRDLVCKILGYIAILCTWASNSLSSSVCNQFKNAATHLLTGTRRHDHITPVVANLHRLPVKYCIIFKIFLYTFKILNNLVPSYLTDLLDVYNPKRALRSSNQLLLVQQRPCQKTRGDRAFAIAAPKLWNNLPIDVRMSDSIQLFKSHLKTHLLKQISLDFHLVCSCAM